MQPHKPKSTTQIGKINTLEVLQETDDGFVLDGGNKDEIFLPKSRAPSNCKAGQKLKVFLYPENDGSIQATCTTPKALVGECAVLKAINIIKAGAFMDWGIEKDLLVPVSQQSSPMVEGKPYVVYLFLDPQQRIIGSSKLHHFLDEDGKNMAPGQAVDLLIVGKTDLGFKAVINGTHLGLLFKNEVFQSLRPGDKTRGYIKAIRADRKIDLSLHSHNKKSREELTDRILAFLESNQGTSTLTDYSPPKTIYQQYGVSKGNYKKALGALYKRRLIRVTKEKISLLTQQSRKTANK
ncbi:MAG: S1-like domain-containing RNA-binding protein [Xanthomonadales bacterium]